MMGEVVSIQDFLLDESVESLRNQRLIDLFRKLINCWKADGVENYFDQSSEVVALSRNIIEMLELTKTTPNEAVAVRKLAKEVADFIYSYCRSVRAIAKASATHD